MKYWISKKGNDRLIVINNEIFYNYNPSEKQLFEFEKDLRHGIIPEKLTGIPFGYIRHITSKNNSTKVIVEYAKEDSTEIDFAENKQEIFTYLKSDEVNSPKYVESNENLISRIKRPLVWLLVIAVMFLYAYSIASDIEMGYEYEIAHGRAKG